MPLPCFVFTLIFALMTCGQAGAQHFNFTSPGQVFREQLPTQCYLVIQDKKGYIWISSDAGLFRYNGSQLRAYSEKEGMPDQAVYHIHEDAAGRIWFSTSKSIVGFIRNDSAFIVGANEKLQQLLEKGVIHVYGMADDEEGNLWLATGKGSYRINAKDRYASLDSFPPVPGGYDFAVRVVRNSMTVFSRIWTNKHKITPQGTMDFTIQLNGARHLRYSFGARKVSPSFFKSLLLHNKAILVSLEHVLLRVLPDGSFTEKHFPGRITHIYEDCDKDLWITVFNSGIYFFKGGDLSSPPVLSLAGKMPASVLVDREGGIWAASLDNRVYYCHSKSVMVYTTAPGLDGHLSAISTGGDRILCSNYNSQVFDLDDPLSPKQILQPLLKKSEHFNEILETENEIYFVGSGALVKADTNLSRLAQISAKGLDRSHYIYDITTTGQGSLKGVSSADIVNIKDQSELAGRLPARGRVIFSRKNGDLLVGTSNGVYRYTNGNFSNLSSVYGLPEETVLMLAEDKWSNLLVATTKGLWVVTATGTQRISTDEGLVSNTCTRIIPDGNTVWLATDKGLCKVETEDSGYRKLKISTYTTHHGLPANEIAVAAMIRGLLWLGTENGLAVVDPMQLRINDIPPTVYISHIFLRDSLIRNAIAEFDHSNNNLRFLVEGLTYKSPGKNAFQWRLLGADSSWHITTSPEINLSNLAPGVYTLEVKALNNDGIPSTAPAAYRFTIRAPFWQTWWFIAGVIVAGTAGMVYFVQQRLTRIKAREEEKTALFKQVAEYQLTAIQAQMNPHFIFNAINSIQHYILSNETQYAYDYLAKFSKLIRQVLDNSRKSMISLSREVELLDIYIDLEQRRFKNKFDYEIKLDDSLMAEEIKVPVMLIQPFAENAIWHGIMNLDGSRKGKLLVQFSLRHGRLHILVEDNGIGRKAAALKKNNPHESVGLRLSRERLEVVSALTDDEADIILVDLYDAANMPSGTRVEITLPLNY